MVASGGEIASGRPGAARQPCRCRGRQAPKGFALRTPLATLPKPPPPTPVSRECFGPLSLRACCTSLRTCPPLPRLCARVVPPAPLYARAVSPPVPALLPSLRACAPPTRCVRVLRPRAACVCSVHALRACAVGRNHVTLHLTVRCHPAWATCHRVAPPCSRVALIHKTMRCAARVLSAGVLLIGPWTMCASLVVATVRLQSRLALLGQATNRSKKGSDKTKVETFRNKEICLSC